LYVELLLEVSTAFRISHYCKSSGISEVPDIDSSKELFSSGFKLSLGLIASRINSGFQG
jgi:hypothetical protein